MENLVNTIATWPFLNEPAWRWAVFFIGFSFFLVGWNGILSFMK